MSEAVFIFSYADGCLRLWDLKSCQCMTTIPKLHEGEVLCIDVNTNGVVATGGADGLKFASIVTGAFLGRIAHFLVSFLQN